MKETGNRKVLKEAQEVLKTKLGISTTLHYSSGGVTGLVVKTEDLEKVLKLLAGK